MDDECEVCGETLDVDNNGDVIEHGHEALVIRDGARGQYLSATLIEDVNAMFPGEFDAEVVDAASRWLGQMGMPSDPPEVSEDEYDAVLDASTYQAENILGDHGMTVIHDDGYVIYRV